MQISEAIFKAWSAIARAESLLLRSKARAAARAYGPPEPIAATPSSGSTTSPFPEIVSNLSLSPTSRSASRRRNTRSVRQSFASSTAERTRLPLNSFSFDSNFSYRVSASAVDPAKPERIFPSRRTRILDAFALITVLLKLTCPSAAKASLLSRRTARTVVERILGLGVGSIINLHQLLHTHMRVPLGRREARVTQ